MKKLDVDWWTNVSVVYKTLNRKFQEHSKLGWWIRRKYKTTQALKDVWIEPKEFIKLTSEVMLNRTGILDMDFWLLTFGYEGSGKSSINLMQYATISKMLNKNPKSNIKKDLIFMQSEYAQAVYLFSKNKVFEHPIQIDDAHYVFGKYLGQTSETQSTLQLARFVRDQQIIHLLNTQVPQQLFTDIWNERVNVYQYCFFVDRVDGNIIVSRDLYVAWFDERETQNVKELKDVRRPLFWENLLSKSKPLALTRFDVLFKPYEEIYLAYKIIKRFYKQFYALTRYFGISKGHHFETLYRMLHDFSFVEKGSKEFLRINDYHINSMPEQTKRKFLESGILVKDPQYQTAKNPEGYGLFEELLELAYKHKEVIHLRSGIRSIGFRKVLNKIKEDLILEDVVETLINISKTKETLYLQDVVNILKQKKLKENIIKKLEEKGWLIINPKTEEVIVAHEL